MLILGGPRPRSSGSAHSMSSSKKTPPRRAFETRGSSESLQLPGKGKCSRHPHRAPALRIMRAVLLMMLMLKAAHLLPHGSQAWWMEGTLPAGRDLSYASCLWSLNAARHRASGVSLCPLCGSSLSVLKLMGFRVVATTIETMINELLVALCMHRW